MKMQFFLKEILCNKLFKKIHQIKFIKNYFKINKFLVNKNNKTITINLIAKGSIFYENIIIKLLNII